MERRICEYCPGRREFLTKQLLAGTLLGLGCQGMLVPSKADAALQKTAQTSGMTTEEVFRFAYEYCVPLFRRMEKELGKKRFIRMLTKASAENTAAMISTMAKNLPARDMKAFADLMAGFVKTKPYNEALKYEVVEKTAKVFEMKFTECLIAKLYREMNASDIGYAIECSPGDAMAKAFNPKMKSENPKNLMKGDSVCIGRYELGT
jgi:L-2-amino-thiazoline-4-carboxylic acid hydrolase